MMKPVLLAAMLIPAAEADRPPTVVVLAVGAAGAPEYGEDFHEWAERWALAADRAGARVVRVGENPAGKTADKQRLEEVLSEQPRQSPASLWLVLIGHGTFDGHSAKFNLRGEDVSAAELGVGSPDPAWGHHFQALRLSAWTPDARGLFRYAAPFDDL